MFYFITNIVLNMLAYITFLIVTKQKRNLTILYIMETRLKECIQCKECTRECKQHRDTMCSARSFVSTDCPLCTQLNVSTAGVGSMSQVT